MADNTPDEIPQSSDSPTAPPLKKPAAGKVVVRLSSVAKTPASKSPVPPPLPVPSGTVKEAPARPSLQVVAPPPLQVKPPVEGRLSGSAEAKLPPPGKVTKWPHLSDAPVGTPVEPREPATPVTPPQPVEELKPVPAAEPKKTTGKLVLPVKLNEPSPAPVVSPATPLPVSPPEPAETKVSPSGEDKPPVETEAKPETPKAPPPLPPPAVERKDPPPLPKPDDKDHPVHVVPRMAGDSQAAHAEKRLPPQLPGSVGKSEGSHVEPSAGLNRAPAMLHPHSPEGATPPPALPSDAAGKLAPPGTISVISVKAASPKTEETKPALRPAVLPNRSLKQVEGASPAEGEKKTDEPAGHVTAPATKSGEVGKHHAPVDLSARSAEAEEILAAKKQGKGPPPLTRVEKAKKKRFVGAIIFYVLMAGIGVGLYFGTLYFARDTRVEGQVIPPPGMPITDEVWIVSNSDMQLNNSVSGIAEDLAAERTPLIQEIREKEEHVQRVQADVASREQKIHMLQAQIQKAKDDQLEIVKQARMEANALWTGPGIELDQDYDARKADLQNAIASRAKSLNLKYAPDPTYNSPEVWANAYRLALYQVPPGVDSAKEYTWLNDQMKAWRDFVKDQDEKRDQLRDQAEQIRTSPAAKLADLNTRIDELQHRIDTAQSEEQPLKPELAQAQTDLNESQSTETVLDQKYYKQLSALPGSSIIKRLPVDPYGRFSWNNLQNDSPFGAGEKSHRFWIFSRATRGDGREYWALGSFTIYKDQSLGLLILPDNFVSTKAMLRPDLSPDEQEQ